MWWAQRNMRATEEICCDALVLSRLHPKPLVYANSILNAVESLTRPAIRPPAMASEINSGGTLERRFKMIISGNSIPSNSLWMHTCVFLLAVVVIPLGLVQAQDFDKVSKRLNKAVNQGHLKQEQADAMMATLHRMGDSTTGPASDDRLPSRIDRAPDQRTGTPRDVYRKAAAELEIAVTNGRISKEEMEKRLGEMRRMMGDSGRNASGETSGAGDKAIINKHRALAGIIQAAQEAGELSPEDARKKLQALRDEMQLQKPIDLRLPANVAERGYEALAQQLKKAVESGDLTEKEARLKLKEFGDKLKSKSGDKGDNERKKATDDKSKAEFDAIAKKIRQAVADGQLTKKEAEAKLKAIKEKARKDQGR